MTLLLVYVLGALSISFLCSILEATLLSVRNYQLAARKAEGDQGAALLLEIKEKRIDDAISAILTLNTIAHTIGAGLAGAQAENIFGKPWLGVFVVVLTILVLVFTEIVPKTIGTIFSDRLVGFVGRTLIVLMRVLSPALVVTKALTSLMTARRRSEVSKRDIRALVSMADRTGSIPGRESRVLSNVLQFEAVFVEDVMTPRTVLKMMPDHSTVADLVQDTEAAGFSRIPLFGKNKDDVVGYVLCKEVLTEALKQQNSEIPLTSFLRKVRYIPENASLSQALEMFVGRKERLTLVVDEYGGVSGVLSLEDLVESVLGAEIVDELDEVADLRAWAAEVRDRRLQLLSEGTFTDPTAEDKNSG